jgi:hypothetical protein
MLYWVMKLQTWLIRFFTTDEINNFDEIIYDVNDEIRYK